MYIEEGSGIMGSIRVIINEDDEVAIESETVLRLTPEEAIEIGMNLVKAGRKVQKGD